VANGSSILAPSPAHTAPCKGRVCTIRIEIFIENSFGYWLYFHSEVTPSFILMAIQGPKVVTYVYELDGDSVVVSKTEFSKAA
jgi:hypothetical protein